MTKTYQTIAQEQLKTGFGLAIDNAKDLMTAAIELCSSHQSKALALAQIGQEEIGKSLTILAAFGLSEDNAQWSWFWDGWRKHDLKAHRAYLYELVSPLTIEISGASGQIHNGLPLRNPISREKEVGLYVDYDPSLRKFTSPKGEISAFDAHARISTLLYLALTADSVRRTLERENVDFRFREFGKLAFTICSSEIYQQDMPAISSELAAKSAAHREMVGDLHIALKEQEKFLTGMTAARHTAERGK